jgi:hypothetical protein
VAWNWAEDFMLNRPTYLLSEISISCKNDCSRYLSVVGIDPGRFVWSESMNWLVGLDQTSKFIPQLKLFTSNVWLFDDPVKRAGWILPASTQNIQPYSQHQPSNLMWNYTNNALVQGSSQFNQSRNSQETLRDYRNVSLSWSAMLQTPARMFMRDKRFYSATPSQPLFQLPSSIASLIRCQGLTKLITRLFRYVGCQLWNRVSSKGRAW